MRKIIESVITIIVFITALVLGWHIISDGADVPICDKLIRNAQGEYVCLDKEN